MSGLYDAFRVNGGPTMYPAYQTPWAADILEAGFVFAFVILAISFFVILPGIRGIEKLYMFIRITVSLYIGAVIMLANFSYTWEVSEIQTRTKYKAGTGDEIQANIGVHIGLRGVNITLKGDPEVQTVGGVNETINYNEYFSWRWEQGRLGFGPFAGRFNQEYRAAQLRGLPLPILWIAEYFTFDGEGIRWGRHYRLAGWYSHIVMWLALPLWVITNILFFILLRYGAYCLMLTGASLLTANLLWAKIRNINELTIPFTAENVLEFHFGGSYWVCLITGILCIILGIVIFVMDKRFPSAIASFFGVDVLQDVDEIQKEDDTENLNGDVELEDMKAADNAPPPRSDRTANAAAEEDDSDDEIYEYNPPVVPQSTKIRKSRGLTQKFQKARRRPPPPVPMDDEDDIYENETYPAAAGDVHVDMP